MSGDRAFWAAVAGLALLAALLRVAFVAYVSPPLPPISDARGYHSMGKHIAAGEGFVKFDPRQPDPTIPTAAYPPLYPALLALLHLAGVTSIGAQRFAVAAFGALNVPLLAALARSCAGPAAGLIAAVLAVVAPGMLEIDGSYMSEVVYVPLVTLTLSLLLRASRAPNAAVWATAGVAAGLAALARSEGLMLFGLLVVPLVWIRIPSGRRLAAYAAATLGLCAVVAPWTLRNAIEFGRFIPVSQNYKGAILGANCAEIYGSPKYRGTWSPRCIHAFDFGGMTEAEIFDRGRDTGLRYAFDHRDQLPAVVAARLLRTWGLYDPAEWQGYAETEVRSSRFQQRTFWIGWGLLALAPVGLVVVRRRSTASFWILAAPIALVCASSVIGYGNTRFRAAAEPALVVLAAVALARFGAARCARPPDSTAG